MIKVNAVGDKCPIPIVKAKNALKELNGSGSVEITVDNVIAAQNLEKFARQSKCGYECTESDGTWIVVITAGEESEAADAGCDECTNTDKDLTVVLSSRTMGTGDDTLGATLMKGFIFALANASVMPGTILLYNGGAFLSAEGSESLDDLKAMEAAGTQIMTCGTCIDFYGLDKNPPVGSVTNMYTIASIMASSKRIVKP